MAGEGTQADELDAAISPDGEWIAYSLSDGNRSDVYVRPFPNVNEGQWQISRDNGREPRWSPDGRNLTYLSYDQNALMEVPVETEPSFRPGNPERLFDWKYHHFGGSRSYDVSRDGRRFLVVKGTEHDETLSTELVVVLNWSSELEHLSSEEDGRTSGQTR